MALTVDQVLGLAPDEASAAAAKKLAQPAGWPLRARSQSALWGECRGSALYQVRVDLADLTAKCSCPSRKFPCKHSLALMLLAASPDLVPPGTPPQWVTEWLEKRAQAAEQREQRQTAKSAKPVDPAAQAKRSAQRLERVRDGLDALDLWMSDLVRNGLATIESMGPAPWETQAARLVDAQAPALAARVRNLAEIPRAEREWANVLAGEMGLVALLSHAFRRIDKLDPALQADVRQLIGWTLKEEEVLAGGDLVDDDWLVIGQRTELEERFRMQRTWLAGIRSGRDALILQFAVTGATFAESFVTGSHGEAVLAFWPSAAPRRALVHDRKGPVTPWTDRLPGHPTIDDFLTRVARNLARQPWSRQCACVLRDVVPVRSAEGWHAIDAAGKALPLSQSDWWPLLALSGGQPIDMAAEWNGRTLSPLFASTPREPHTWIRGAQ